MKLKMNGLQTNNFKLGSKKIKSILMVSLVLILNSCSKSDNASSTPPPSLIGKWEYVKADTKDGTAIISTQSFDPLPSCVRNNITFKNDNNLDLVQYSAPCAALNQTLPYTLNNNSLGFQGDTKTIEKLTNTELVYSQPTGPYITVYSLRRP